MTNLFFTMGSKVMKPNRFYRETTEQSEVPSSKGMKPIEAMKDPGFHIGKIDRASLNSMEEFGIQMKPSKDPKGMNGIELNGDRKFDVVMIDPKGNMEEIPNEAMLLDSDTLKIESRTTIVNGIKVLGIVLFNRDGTQEALMFVMNPKNIEKMKAPQNTFDLGDIYKIDTITHDLGGKSSKEQFPDESKKIFQKAKSMGIRLESDNSRSNGIVILDKNSNNIGNIKVFMNPNWKKELVNTLERVTK